jgi:tRNA threonylcarbamoyladenosine biosynthesis protein TsaE
MRIECLLEDPSATERLAGLLAGCFEPGFTLYLSGGLGAGKTTLTRALLRSLGFPGRVKSPTFSLLEPYNLAKFELHHYDFYRLDAPDAWREAGFETSFDGRVAVVVEWPEMAGGTLPRPDLGMQMRLVDTDFECGRADDESRADRRIATIRAHSERGRACLSRLVAAGCCRTAQSPA